MTETEGNRNESRRREYLALMGIQPWYARVVPKNAGPSPVFPVESPKPRRARPPDAPARRSGQPTQRAAAPAQRPVRARPPPAESAAGAARAVLHYLRVDDSLALLAQDEWENAEGAQCRDLLANILQALGRSLAAGAEIAVPHRDPAATDAARGRLLEDLCQRDRCPNLLIFAHDDSELFPQAAPSATDFSRLVGGVRMQVTITRGLREMLAFPDLKKLCWRDLQPLRGRLGRLSGAQAPDQERNARE